MSTPEIGYADALSELQEILGELEAEDIDIDVLAVKVERAAELIRVCRGRNQRRRGAGQGDRRGPRQPTRRTLR